MESERAKQPNTGTSGGVSGAAAPEPPANEASDASAPASASAAAPRRPRRFVGRRSKQAGAKSGSSAVARRRATALEPLFAPACFERRPTKRRGRRGAAALALAGADASEASFAGGSGAAAPDTPPLVPVFGCLARSLSILYLVTTAVTDCVSSRGSPSRSSKLRPIFRLHISYVTASPVPMDHSPSYR